MDTTEFRFACEGTAGPGSPWEHLKVVRFQGHEEISALYRYEITLLWKAPSPEIDPIDLIDRRASLRIATHSAPEYKVVHGVIAEAEELYAVPDGMLLRVVIKPPLIRAAYRRRCRIFLEKTLRQILTAVLQGDPNLKPTGDMAVSPDDGDLAEFTAASELFAFRISDTSRLDNVAARPYVVQYNESDHAFFSRLLEEEGISYHFENGKEQCLLVLSDADAGRARLDPFLPLAEGLATRAVSSIKLGARLRPKQVSLDDYNWRKPALDMLAEAKAQEPSDQSLFEYSYPGGYPDAPAQGKPLATARVERYDVESDYATLEIKARVLSAGSIFHLQHPKTRYDGEYLVTTLDTRGFQEGILAKDAQGFSTQEPFLATLECARRGRGGAIGESHFRPAIVTPKPRIVGSQTAFVTADPASRGAEINIGGPDGGPIGCVRLKFHWDRDADRLGKEPSSSWVRVSQSFAGVGQGGVFHPRVGVEVIVDFSDGDPDRPIITGRVYNGANLPPSGPSDPTKSTMKTFTSPHNGKFNELSFQDRPGAEEMKIHAARDWNSEVGRNRAESVTTDSSSSVGSNRSESTGSNRSTSVGANNMEVIGANESTTVGANHTMSVGVNQTSLIGVNQSVSVGSSQSVSVGSNQDVTVGGSHTHSTTGSSATTIGAGHTLAVTGGSTTSVTGPAIHTATGPQNIHSDALQVMTAPAQTISADGAQTLTSTIHAVIAGAIAARSAGAIATTDAPVTIITGEGVLVLTGSTTIMAGSAISINGGAIAINGGTVDVQSGAVTVNGGGSIDMSAGVIKLN